MQVPPTHRSDADHEMTDELLDFPLTWMEAGMISLVRFSPKKGFADMGFVSPHRRYAALPRAGFCWPNRC